MRKMGSITYGFVVIGAEHINVIVFHVSVAEGAASSPAVPILFTFFYNPPLLSRGDRGADWFGFKHKSHHNREIKMHAVRFGSVGF
jgi:hypothetical protein